MFRHEQKCKFVITILLFSIYILLFINQELPKQNLELDLKVFQIFAAQTINFF